MLTILEKIFLIKPNEWKHTSIFFFLVFLFSLGATFSRSISITLLIEHMGKDSLPLMFILTDLAAMVGFFVYVKLSQKNSGAVIFKYLSLANFFLTLLSWFLFSFSYAWIYGYFFVLSSFFFILTFIHATSFVASYYNVLEMKRMGSFIFSGIPLGAILGGSGLVFGLKFFSPEYLVIVPAVCSLLTIGVIGLIDQNMTPIISLLSRKKLDSIEDSGNALGQVFHSRLIVYMALGIFFFVLTSKVIEYQCQGIIFPEYFPLPQDRASFLGVYEIVGNILALFIQVFVTSKLLIWMGVGCSNIIYPALLFLGSLNLLVVFGLASGIFAQFINQELRRSLRAPLYNLLYNAIPSSLWASSKAFLNGVIFPFSTIVAGIFLFLVTKYSSSEHLLTILPFASMAFACCAIFLALPQWKNYNAQILVLLEKQSLPLHSYQEEFRGLNLDQQIEDILAKKNLVNLPIALDFIRLTQAEKFLPLVKDFFWEVEDFGLRRKCLQTLSGFPNVLNPLVLQKAIKEESSPAIIALLLEYLGNFRSLDLRDKILPFWKHSSAEVSSQAAVCLYQNDFFQEKEKIIKWLGKQLQDPKQDPSPFIRALGKTQNPSAFPLIELFINSPNGKEQFLAYQATGRLWETVPKKYAPILLKGLENPDQKIKLTSFKAITRLEVINDWFPIVSLLGDKSPVVIRTAKDFLRLHIDDCKRTCLDCLLADHLPALQKFEILSLIHEHLNREEILSLEDLGQKSLQKIFEVHYLQITLLTQYPEEKEWNILFTKCFQELEENYWLWILTIITYQSGKDEEFFWRVNRGIVSSDKSFYGNALEALSHSKEKKLSRALVKYHQFRPTDSPSLKKLYYDIFKEEFSMDNLAWKKRIVQLPHDFLRAVAIYTFGKKNVFSTEENSRVSELLGYQNSS